jgi:hypothetical protein
VVGAPHRRPQFAFELTFEVTDGSGVRLPRLSGGFDRRLERLQLLDRFGPPVLPLVEAVDEGSSPTMELIYPWLDPVRHEPLRLLWRHRPFDAGEVPALGHGGAVGPVVDEHTIEDDTGFGQVVVLGDDVDAVLVPSAGGGDVEPSMGGGGRGEGDADVDGVALVAVLGGGLRLTSPRRVHREMTQGWLSPRSR